MSIARLGGREVYRNRWLSLREDRVRFASGAEGIYGVVDKPDFVLVVPRHADGRLQLVRQYRYPVGGRFWEFPQGSSETRPDAPPEEVARAELEEETGFRAGRLEFLARLHPSYGFCSQGCSVYVAGDLSPGRLAREETEADMETAAFSEAEVIAMIRAGAMTDAASIGALGLLALTR